MPCHVLNMVDTKNKEKDDKNQRTIYRYSNLFLGKSSSGKEAVENVFLTILKR